jgi:hypothetical protein
MVGHTLKFGNALVEIFIIFWIQLILDAKQKRYSLFSVTFFSLWSSPFFILMQINLLSSQ